MRNGLLTRRSRASLENAGELCIHRVLAREFGNVDLWPTRSPHSPNDPNDDTDILLTLPGEIPGNASLTLEIEFEAKLPRLVERAGYANHFHAVAQWFPKLARRTKDGQFRHFAYNALAEFSADFGNYDVTLEVPTTFDIAAPGIATQLPAPNGRKRSRYLLSNAHDFAWFAWDQFIVSVEQFANVTVSFYGSKSQGRAAALTFDTLRWALPRYNAQFTPYPYLSLVVVHPPDDASAAGGMEYPGLIVTGGPWYLGYSPGRFVESLTLHEFAHQWFYGLVANDEYRDPFLDEGVTTFVEAWSLKERFGDGSAFASSWLQWSEANSRRAIARQHSRLGPLARKAIDFPDFSALSGQVYARFSTFLETLGNVYGNAKLLETLGHYAARYRFAHPEPEDFVQVLSADLGSGAELALRTALFSDGWVDYAVIAIENTISGSAQFPPSTNPARPPPLHYDNCIRLERRGTLDFPVTLEVMLKNGQVLRKELAHVDEHTSVRWDTSSPIVCATLDPDELITLDDDLENQTFRIAARTPPLRLWALVYALTTSALGLVLP